MQTVLSIISDIIIILFNCGLYISLTPLKKENKLYKSLMFGGCLIVMIAYILVAYVAKVPYSIASSICMTIPSFALFFSLSKYKNSRFFVTFCFVDTITFIIAAFAKLALHYGGTVESILSCVALLLICGFSFIKVYPYRLNYRELMETVDKGWGPMAISGVFIYILLIFSASYPKPLLERPDYIPLYAIICVTSFTFYGVFILLIKEKSKLIKANILLQEQQHWHKLAYIDELTQLSNKAAYDSRVLEITNEENHDKERHILMIDIDKFKNVNDTYGHLVGNEVLKNTANLFKSIFSNEYYEVFRVGGDEFVVIATAVDLDEVIKMTNIVNTSTSQDDLKCTFSCGFATINFNDDDPFEQAFFEADKAMYAEKARKNAN